MTPPRRPAGARRLMLAGHAAAFVAMVIVLGALTAGAGVAGRAFIGLDQPAPSASAAQGPPARRPLRRP